MSTATLFSFLLAAFVVSESSLPYNVENYDIANEKVVNNFLENNILGVIDSSQFCDDPYLALCSFEPGDRTNPAHLKQAYRNIRDYLIHILELPIAINEVTSLSVEKSLYRKCMDLGLKSDTANLHATNTFLEDLNENVLDMKDTWKNVDRLLNSRGFGWTFFDIAVERDPMNPRRNIIVIQPPSAGSINNLIEWATMISKSEPSPDNTQKPWKFFDAKQGLVPVKQLFNRLQEIVSKSRKQPKQERISLIKWTELYNTKSSGKPIHSSINWKKLVVKTFEPFDIEVKENDAIIVRNMDYFYSLVDLLSDNKNDVIVSAIKAKVFLGDIRLIDFKYAGILKHRKKSLFCYENTKLYGASYRLLRDLKRHDSNNAANYEILNKMIFNIAEVFAYKIDESSDLSPKEKRYLKAQVKLITSHIVKYKITRNVVDDYYDTYNNTETSYFASILKYRKMLKDKELKTLKDFPELSSTEPFSVIDLAKPRNRFIINVIASSFLLSRDPIPSGLQKEVHYGIYGVSIASFLYALLNENRFNNEINLSSRVNWFAHPKYPAKSLKCFLDEDIKSYGWSLASEAVSQIFGARFAYEALLEDYEESDLERQKEFLLLNAKSELQAIEADQLFFVSYAKFNCHLGEKLLETILLNLNEYDSAYKCGSKRGEFQTQCTIDAFQMQGKHHFVNKPF